MGFNGNYSAPWRSRVYWSFYVSSKESNQSGRYLLRLYVARDKYLCISSKGLTIKLIKTKKREKYL